MEIEEIMLFQPTRVPHQYIVAETKEVKTETLFADSLVNWMYSSVREKTPKLFDCLTSQRMTQVLGFVNYETLLGSRLTGNKKFISQSGINKNECLDDVYSLDTPKKFFERKIKYWEYRPLPMDPDAIVSPCDSRVLLGSFETSSSLFIKEKFFDFEELIGQDKTTWMKTFRHGDFGVFRLTPEKYHYNHSPVSGKVVDFYSLDGNYHSCNPNAIIQLASLYSKNKRIITVIDTNVEGGSGIGKVMMIEVVALMIGDIAQCYSTKKYQDPQPVQLGLFMNKGQPKSLFRPGSSTTVLIFEKDKVSFDQEILENMNDSRAHSRFSYNFNEPLVETEVRVRSYIGDPLRKKD